MQLRRRFPLDAQHSIRARTASLQQCRLVCLGHQRMPLVWLGGLHKVLYGDVTFEEWPTFVQITTRPSLGQQLPPRVLKEIIAVLRLFELDAIADRLGYLRQLVEDEPDEPSMSIESLRALALFLMANDNCPIRESASPQTDWHKSSGDSLPTVFWPWSSCPPV